MLYFAGHLGWTPRESDAVPLLRLPGPTVLSVSWPPELDRWVLLYAETGGDIHFQTARLRHCGRAGNDNGR